MKNINILSIIMLLCVVLGGEIVLYNFNKNTIINDVNTQAVEIDDFKETHKECLLVKKRFSQKRIEQKKVEEVKEVDNISRGEVERGEKFKVSFYGLDYVSCEKKKNHPAYGITKSGFNLKGLDWKEARTIATDPKVIPTGSKVILRFTDEKYNYLSGEWIARDTGRLIKDQKIDCFMGEDAYDLCMELGVTEAFVQILN